MNLITRFKKDPLLYIALTVVIIYAYTKFFQLEGLAATPGKKMDTLSLDDVASPEKVVTEEELVAEVTETDSRGRASRLKIEFGGMDLNCSLNNNTASCTWGRV
tara:strand:+ start:233 stop:544 length:312 start_codon:yes stop_codon:yes gene_type:complete